MTTPDTPPKPARDTGLLLINLGTPAAPTASAVRRYLSQFLRDPRVVELPKLLWYPVLYGVILPLRGLRSAANYRRIWTPTGSPLLVHSQALTERLRSRLPELRIGLAMRYGEPSIPQVLDALRSEAELRRLIVLPLYPQYAAATTASAFDAVTAALRQWRVLPQLAFIRDYHTDPEWLDAVAASIRQHWATHGRGQRLLFSFHGLPQRCVDAGDPYAQQCMASAQAIAQRLQLADEQWQLSYQSRVGREAWLQPYTEQTVQQLAQQGCKQIDVVCPGFAVDCLETLEEIAMLNAERFRAAGGEALNYIPCLNADAAHVDALVALLRKHLAGDAEAKP